MKIWSKTRFVTEQRLCHPYHIKHLTHRTIEHNILLKGIMKVSWTKGKNKLLLQWKSSLIIFLSQKVLKNLFRKLGNIHMSFPSSQELGIRNAQVGFHLSAPLSLSLICQQRDRDSTSEQPSLLAARCNELKSAEFSTHLSRFLLLVIEWRVCRCPPCRPAFHWKLSWAPLLDFCSSITHFQRTGNLIIWSTINQIGEGITRTK